MLSLYQAPVNLRSRNVEGSVMHKANYFRDFRSSEMSYVAEVGRLLTDASGQPTGPNFEIEAVQETSVTNYQSTLCDVP